MTPTKLLVLLLLFSLTASSNAFLVVPGSVHHVTTTITTRIKNHNQNHILHATTDQDTSSLSTPAALKTKLLRAIGNQNRSPSTNTAEILESAAKLEETNTRSGNVSGRWSLVFSTQTGETTPKSGDNNNIPNIMDLPQEISNRIYNVLFKVAPFLAGGSDVPGRSSASSPSPIKVINEQTVDEQKGRIDNRVKISAFGQSLVLRVFGTAKPTTDEDRLQICFEGFEVNGFLTFPLPRPKGEIVTTFVDEDLRLSRGSRGGLFVLKRMQQ